MLAWLAATPLDALVLQETKLSDDKFPRAEFAAAGWRAVCFGQKTYNGVALLSRTEASDVVRNIPGFAGRRAAGLLQSITRACLVTIAVAVRIPVEGAAAARIQPRAGPLRQTTWPEPARRRDGPFA